jgi:hypothetical protein
MVCKFLYYEKEEEERRRKRKSLLVTHHGQPADQKWAHNSLVSRQDMCVRWLLTIPVVSIIFGYT